MTNDQTVAPSVTVGLDIGDRASRVYEVDAGGHRLREGTVATTRPGFTRYFESHVRCRVVLEVGTHSPWIAREIARFGHEVIVANPSAMYGRRRRSKRNDQMDAEFLARQGRADIQLLHPIQHRGAEAQRHLALIRARDQLVRARTKLVNHVRGAVKAVGSRIVSCSAEAFPRRASQDMPDELRLALAPLIEVIADLTCRIRDCDREVRQLAVAYPETRRLQEPAGVGPLTAIAYVLLVEDPLRFAGSRDVGAYFGLVPRLDESSSSQPQLRISKAGDELGRRLLVSAAQYILGPFGPECDLRRFGLALSHRGGRNAKKRAVVAVARKLAVLLHRLWLTDEPYNPNRLSLSRAA